MIIKNNPVNVIDKILFLIMFYLTIKNRCKIVKLDSRNKNLESRAFCLHLPVGKQGRLARTKILKLG
jgi:hypothetical protein